MEWARANEHVVFTHDLDFRALLALTRSSAHDVLPEHLEHVILKAIRTYQGQLEQGAIVTVDELRARMRVLPIGSSPETIGRDLVRCRGRVTC